MQVLGKRVVLVRKGLDNRKGSSRRGGGGKGPVLFRPGIRKGCESQVLYGKAFGEEARGGEGY